MIAFIVGLLFGLSLVISGMSKRSKVVGFLTINKNWDPSLAFVLAAAVGGNLLTFHFILKKKQPLLAPNFEIPKNNKIDSKLITGAALFGAVKFNKYSKTYNNFRDGD